MQNGDENMRFILYNIRYGTGKYLHQPLKHVRGYLGKSVEQTDKIGDFLKEYKPDVVGLVEVDLGSYRTRRKNQATFLGKQLGHYGIYEHKYSQNSSLMKVPVLRRQGNAFLSGLQVEGQKFHYFNNGMKKLVIELETKDFSIFLIHLALGAKTRLKQIVELYEVIDSCTKPFIIAGDFNLFWGEEEIELFLRALNLKNANIKNVPTYPSWRPKKVLDFIIYSEGIKINDFKVLTDVKLSDHLPLYVDFETI